MYIHVTGVNGEQITVIANATSNVKDLIVKLPMYSFMVLRFGERDLNNGAEFLSDIGISADTQLEIHWSKHLAIKYLQEKNVLKYELFESEYERKNSFANYSAIISILNTTDMNSISRSVLAMLVAQLNINSLSFETRASIAYASLLHLAFDIDPLNLELVRLLVIEYGLDVNAKYLSTEQTTLYPLIMCSQNLNGFEMAEFLIGRGADINARIQSYTGEGSTLVCIQSFIDDISGQTDENDKKYLSIAKKIKSLISSHK